MPDPSPEALRDAAALLSRMASLEAAVDQLTGHVKEVSRRLGPVEESIAAEAREREVAAAVRAKLREAGVDVADDPTTGVHVLPGAARGWVRDITDAAATTGGGRILAGVVAVVLAITAPELLAVVAPLVGMAPPAVVEVVDGDPPALPDAREPVDDSPHPLDEPTAPRPSL